MNPSSSTEESSIVPVGSNFAMNATAGSGAGCGVAGTVGKFAEVVAPTT